MFTYHFLSLRASHVVHSLQSFKLVLLQSTCVSSKVAILILNNFCLQAENTVRDIVKTGK
jgi:hypothetical protein